MLVFDDKKINHSLQLEGEFQNSHIDDTYNFDDPNIHSADTEALQLKDSNIPRGLVPLEELFDRDYITKNPTMVPTEKQVEDVNAGMTEYPKLVKLSKPLSPKTKGKYMSLMKEYFDSFAWDYSDLKFPDKSIIQHTIPIKPVQNPFHQKLRIINPKLLTSIEKEENILYNSGIIVPIWFSNWISNLVPMRKKTGEIRLCIDFRNLNKLSLKDNYPLPNMDHIL